VPIEAKVTARFKAHQNNLHSYEQSFGSAVWQEYPLSVVERERLLQMHQQLNLSTAEVEAIEARITAEVQAYHQKLQEYEQLFTNAIQQEHPLSEASRANLRQQQQQLGLNDVEIAPIEAKITTQVETYQQKLQQYEQAYVKATQRKYYPDEVAQKQLQQTWQALSLNEIEVETINAHIKVEIATHQSNLQQYEQVFREAVREEYPLSEILRSKLTKHYLSLNLSVEDVAAIETPIVAVFEEHRQKLQQYEQVFRESIQFEYPLSNATREDLLRFQQVLELRDKEVIQLEEKVVSQSELNKKQSQQSDNLQALENSPPQVKPQYRIEDPAQFQELVPLISPTSSPSTSTPSSFTISQKATLKSTNSENLEAGSKLWRNNSAVQQRPNSFLQFTKKIFAGLLIACGSLWALFCMIGALSSFTSPGFGFVIVGVFLTGLGLLVAWEGVRLWRH